MSDQPPDTAKPTPAYPPQRTPRKKYGPGRPRKGEVREPKLPVSATEAEAKANAKKLALQVSKAVWEGKDGLPKGDTRWLVNPASVTMAHLKHIVGDDVEKFKQELAYELLGTAVLLRRKIEEDIDSLPPSSLAFTMSVCVDKASQLLTKLAASSAGAAVGTQINVFADGKIDREALMRQLLGQAKPADKEPPEAAGPVVDV